VEKIEDDKQKLIIDNKFPFLIKKTFSRENSFVIFFIPDKKKTKRKLRRITGPCYKRISRERTKDRKKELLIEANFRT
jgi:hypothetical protein